MKDYDNSSAVALQNFLAVYYITATSHATYFFLNNMVLKGESNVTSNAWCTVLPYYLAVVYFTMLPV
jgi:hypothetical protein